MKRYTIEEVYSKLLTAKEAVKRKGILNIELFLRQVIEEFEKEENNDTYTKIYKDNEGNARVETYDIG